MEKIKKATEDLSQAMMKIGEAMKTANDNAGQDNPNQAGSETPNQENPDTK